MASCCMYNVNSLAYDYGSDCCRVTSTTTSSFHMSPAQFNEGSFDWADDTSTDVFSIDWQPMLSSYAAMTNSCHNAIDTNTTCSLGTTPNCSFVDDLQTPVCCSPSDVDAVDNNSTVLAPNDRYQIDDNNEFRAGSDVTDAQCSAARRSRRRRRRVTAIQRQAANRRERRRMCLLNDAFNELRNRIPLENYERRPSRIDTLKLAAEYIHFMISTLTSNY